MQATAILVISAPDRPRRPRSWSYRVVASGPVMRMMRLAREVTDRNPVNVTRHRDTSDTGIEVDVILMTPEAFQAEIDRGMREVAMPVDPEYAPHGRALVGPWHEILKHRVAKFEAREIHNLTAGELGYW